jgi:hypothetical protein
MNFLLLNFLSAFFKNLNSSYGSFPHQQVKFSQKELDALNLLKKYDEYHLSIDIFSLAKKMNFHFNFVEQQHRLIILPEKKGIYIKASEPLMSKRYLTAFSIGYLMTHHKDFYSSDNSFTIFSLNNLYENQFAMYLLMPRQFVYCLVDKKEYCKIEKLAETFNVSEVAILQRLKDLKLVS